MMTNKLIILGTGGNCLDILEAVNCINEPQKRFEVVGFLDDDTSKHGMQFLGVPVLGSLDNAHQYEDCVFVNGIGSPTSFAQKEAMLVGLGICAQRFVSIIHPHSSVAASASIGNGTVLLANTTVCANAVVGEHVMVLPGTTISHDCTIANYATIASGVVLCGEVTLALGCYIGAGSVIRGGVTVNQHSLVGAGSVVLNDVDEKTVVCGNPATLLHR